MRPMTRISGLILLLALALAPGLSHAQAALEDLMRTLPDGS